MDLLIPDGNLILRDHNFRVGGSMIGINNFDFVLSREENKDIEVFLQKMLNNIASKTGAELPIGSLIRYDCVLNIPQNNPSIEENKVCLGRAYVDSAYEVNFGGIECVLALAALMQVKDTYCQNYVEIVANAISKYIESLNMKDKRVLLVMGKAAIKDALGPVFLSFLQNESLDILVCNERKAMQLSKSKCPKIIWRLGDIRAQGESEYSEDFVQWLYRKKETDTVIINPLPGRVDFSNKALLMEEGQDKVLFPMNIPWAVRNKDRLVLKQLFGKHGSGITLFGKQTSTREWGEALVVHCWKKNYGLFQFRKLPTVLIPKLGKVKVDLNATCMIKKGGEIEVLYYVVRTKNAELYKKNPIMNVSSGASFGEVCVI